MPASLVKKVVDTTGLAAETVEGFWEKAKQAAEKTTKKDSPNFYGLVTSIFKSILKKELDSSQFSKLGWREALLGKSRAARIYELTVHLLRSSSRV